jgi:alpha,alpha-trehalase
MNFGFARKMFVVLFLIVVLGRTPLLSQTVQQSRPDIAAYIHSAWGSLERSTNDCNSVVDPKVTSKPVVYLPAGMKMPAALAEMRRRCGVQVDHLPGVIRRLGDVRPASSFRPGLLYLPNPYVVPGGRFNEMYGWDSYFIVLGLIGDGRIPIAKGIVENFFFEIANYGAVLNANRTYFLTRSQPPLLSSMISEVYGNTHDTEWLRSAYKFAESDYALWTTPNHQAGETGLARYFDLGAGPVPEMADDSTYYPDVIRWLVAHPEQRNDYLVKGSEHPAAEEANRLQTSSCNVLDSRVCADAYADGFRLSASFYRGDRAMRESGFDTTFRFGPFSGSTDQFAPVCLNSLLYKYERDLSTFASLLGKPAESRKWLRKAEARKQAILKYLWNPDAGTFSDYNFVTKKSSPYRYVSEFYPLWAGLATPTEAANVEHQLPTFEREGGLAMSDRESGTQWDMPFGWAPAHWFVIEGLRKYGFTNDSNRLSNKFRHTVEANYLLDGTIREKYNVVDGSANIAVAAGYKANVIGFGWTNGVYERLAHQPKESQTSQASLPRVDSGQREDRLRFALILSRHGVRPPLEQASAYASNPWPSWEVPLGHLTPHGAEALRRMGSYLRLVYTKDGLLAGGACPIASDIYLYSDTDERNVSSTRAMFSEFVPGCGTLPIHTVNPNIQDPLFRSDSRSLLSSVDVEAVRRAALLEEVPNVYSAETHAQLELLQRILAPDPTHPAKKSIFDSEQPPSVDGGDIVAASKPRFIASEIVEDLLLEYADDKPLSDVGWGRVDKATLNKLMPLRISAFNLEKRTPAFAIVERSNLLAHILITLDQAATSVATHGAIGPPGTRLVYISGHDSDLAGISGLLGLHWTTDARTDDTPPDSQIVFELWQRGGRTQDVLRIRYRGQTLDQLRTASLLTLSRPPDEVLVLPPGCTSVDECPWEVFHKEAVTRLSSKNVRSDLTPSQIVQW